ncbi:hypothetical protein NHX12_025383 [Muraenolepis orangiensis]|uniref:VWFA domain-containing protein n=1 Tax=Muraenolepis orangiensis TaxID=630683 RepID=A0A9Q0IRI6_9TELE|nr:hypothetical protein NHX12_025383 [Muraenolepis orangiensis]
MSLGLSMTNDPASGKVMACGPTITREYCPGLLDIAFLLDGSGSVSNRDFNTMKDFVKSLIQSLRGWNTRFSITHTKVFSQRRGSRSTSKKVLIVITDGASNDYYSLKDAVKKAADANIVRFAIGVGQSFSQPTAKTELVTIGSTPTDTHVFQVDNFNALEVIRAGLEESIFSIEGAQTGEDLKMEMAQEGFSAAYVPGGFQMASVGAYGWSGGFQSYLDNGQLTFSQEKELVDPDSYLGYSMAVAKTIKGPVTIVGAPRYHHRGVVFVFSQSFRLSQTVDPSPWQFQIGEYFGAEIMAMAVVPSQPYSQVVLISAPLHMEEGWEGRVYVCTLIASRVDCQFDAPVVLRGQAGERGRFGSSMAPLPDLNQDGVYDLAVGAPLENQGQGSVYIFHGDARGTMNTRISQRLAASDVRPGLRFFGLSISRSSLDLSGDGLPDLAVGSKGTVVLLRSKPIVMVEAQVVFSPAQIPSSSSSSDCITPVKISATVCFTMTRHSAVQTVQARINFTLSLDTTRKRAFFVPKVRTQSESFNLSLQGRCFPYDFYVEPCPEDSLNALFNELHFWFDGLPSNDNLRPSLAQQAQTISRHPLGFKINCDNPCVDELRVRFNFSGSSAVQVGIDDLLTVTASLSNLGEDSYSSQVILTYPAGLSFRKFSTVQGRVECSSLDSENGVSLGRSSCLVYKPIFKSNAKAVFNVSYGIDSNSQLSRKILITANATSGNVDHSQQSELFQKEEIGVKYSIFLSIGSSLSYTNFSFGKSDLYKPVVNPVKVLNFVRAFNVTVLIKVPVRLGVEKIWMEDLQIPECRRDGEQEPNIQNFQKEIQHNLVVDCSVASCLVFRCNMFMGREQNSTFTIAANLSSRWIEQIGLQSAKFLLISTATLEYDEDQYIFYSTESKNAPPIRKIVTEVEVYTEANFTKEIVGGAIGGLILLAIITAGLYKAGFFKSQYKQMIEDAGGDGEGGEGGEGGGDGGDGGGEAP